MTVKTQQCEKSTKNPPKSPKKDAEVFPLEIFRNPKLKKRVFENHLRKTHRKIGNRDEKFAE